MSFAEYTFKLSLSLALIYLFYQCFLKQLTFYQLNRYYLLFYPLLCFVIPFIDVSVFAKDSSAAYPVITNVPTVNDYIPVVANNLLAPSAVSIFIALFMIGVFAALIRVVAQYLSFKKVAKKSVLLFRDGNVNIYLSDSAGAFSFANNIYINPRTHNEEDMQRMLLHEIVHVKQQHFIDIVVAEMLCIVNWFNPFAWLIRRAVRRNLEFIADHNVLSNGYDKTEYQFLLLKVTGIGQYRIAAHFNIADLKKRIAMMNKIKSARVHTVKFLFTLPMLVIVLLAFRKETKTDPVATQIQRPELVSQVKDTVPPQDEKAIPERPTEKKSQAEPENKNGYTIYRINTDGEQIVLIRGKEKKSLLAMTLDDWMKNKKENEEKYGELPPLSLNTTPLSDRDFEMIFKAQEDLVKQQELLSAQANNEAWKEQEKHLSKMLKEKSAQFEKQQQQLAQQLADQPELQEKSEKLEKMLRDNQRQFEVAQQKLQKELIEIQKNDERNKRPDRKPKEKRHGD
jgi:beta-lactamase regulating signal transducer with metallopeptidase domain